MDAVKSFDRLERSGGGFVVPLMLFGFGMFVTVMACLAIRRVDERIEQRIRNQPQHAEDGTLVEHTRNALHVIV